MVTLKITKTDYSGKEIIRSRAVKKFDHAIDAIQYLEKMGFHSVPFSGLLEWRILADNSNNIGYHAIIE